MEIDVTIERISNGFIISQCDETQEKRYYESLEKFAIAEILEPLKEIDKEIKHGKPNKEMLMFKLITNA